MTTKQRAVEGRATEEARRALAEALGLSSSAVTLVAGATSRSKVFDATGADPGRLDRLLAG